MPSRARDDALSEVVGFVLILGVLVIVMSLYQLYVVPAQGREDEIAHLNTIKDQFVSTKTSMDSLWINNQSGITISTSYQLGTLGGYSSGGGITMPLLSPIGSTAKIALNMRESNLQRVENFTITTNATSVPGNYPINFTMGKLAYISDNNYWIQQTYYYQMGGVFLKQDDGITARVSPVLSIYKVGDSQATIRMAAIALRGGGEIGGGTPVRVDTRLMEMPAYKVTSDVEWVNLTVDVANREYAEAWLKVFNDTIRRGNIPDTWWTFGISGDDTRGQAYVNIIGSSAVSTNDVSLYVTRADFAVYLQNVAGA